MKMTILAGGLGRLLADSLVAELQHSSNASGYKLSFKTVMDDRGFAVQAVGKLNKTTLANLTRFTNGFVRGWRAGERVPAGQ